jgi:predicted GNAT family acetyltransferase
MRSRGESDSAAVVSQQLLTAGGTLTSRPLTNGHEEEVLDFLSARYLQTFYLAGLIRDNGLESPHNRGTFYGCRDAQGRLIGVALIGHAVVFETHSEAVLEAFARLAQNHPLAHMVAGTSEDVERFWGYYARAGGEARRICRDLLFVQRTSAGGEGPALDLRQATLVDLTDVMHVQAQMACEQSGVNPLEADPEGFRLRCARRIEKGRVWIMRQEGRLIFKADVLADTPEVNYLEGVYVTPELRGRGYGVRCMAQLNRHLSDRAGALCVLVDEQNHAAQAFFRHAGFAHEDWYEMIYLRLPN